MTKATIANTLIAQFNDMAAVERLFAKYPGEIAAVIVEPIMMNVGILMPDPGYLQALRSDHANHGALLIFDEVKTGAKLARGGACEYFQITPDMVCLAKSIGGGFSLAAFASRAGDHGPDHRPPRFPRRYLQHQSGRHGRRACRVPRGADAGGLRARDSAE